jgi:tetratricopeptide (TPR) repeat protein
MNAGRGRTAGALLIPLLVLAAFHPGLGNTFVGWDDDKYIRDNPLLSEPDGLRRIWLSADAPQYYPLTFTSYWLEYRLWGPWPAGYFLTNLALHSGASALLYLTLLALGMGGGAAWLAAAIFAIHPIQVSSVAWLAERKNVLCGVFFFAAMLLHLHSVRRADQRLFGCGAACFLAALLSKTAAVPLPLSLLAAERLLLRSEPGAALRRSAPLLAMAAVFALITVGYERASSPAAAQAGLRPLTAAAAAWAYVGKILWPHPLMGLYPDWGVSAAAPLWWLPAAGLVAVTAAVCKYRAAIGALTTWGLTHFFLCLLPGLGLIPFGFSLSSPIGDQLVYFALPGFVVALLSAGQRILDALAARRPVGSAAPAGGWASRILPGLAGALLLLACGMKSWHQVQIWRDGETFWRHTLRYNPRQPLAHNNLGVALARQGRTAEAMACYREAARLNPGYIVARSNLATLLRNEGRADEALAEFEAIVRDNPDNAAARFNLALTLAAQGRRQEACEQFAEAVRIDPGYGEAYTNWGVVLLEDGRVEEGLSRLRTALELNPADVVAHFNLGVALAGQGQFDRAFRHYEAVMRLDPDNAPIHSAIGAALMQRGYLPDALRFLRKALELNPRDVAAHLNLGLLAVQALRPQDAEQHFRAVLELDPNHAEATHNLGALLVQEGRYQEGAQVLTHALLLRPDHASTHYMLALAALALEDAGAAEEHLRRAIELEPDDLEAHERLAELLAAAGRGAEAATVLRQAAARARATGHAVRAAELEERAATVAGG